MDRARKKQEWSVQKTMGFLSCYYLSFKPDIRIPNPHTGDTMLPADHLSCLSRHVNIHRRGLRSLGAVIIPLAWGWVLHSCRIMDFPLANEVGDTEPHPLARIYIPCFCYPGNVIYHLLWRILLETHYPIIWTRWTP